MAINTINIGATANDGTGDAIRTAFDTVNENFQFVQGGLFAGTESSIISALSITGGHVISNTYITSDTLTTNDLTITGSNGGNLLVQSNGALIYGNVTIVGNLSVSGSQQSTQSSSATAPIILIHANAAPYTLNDDKDIGLEWQYYDGADKYGFLGRQNSSGSLVYLDNVTDTSNVITAGTPGNVQFGSLLISNTTSSTSNITGALQVQGGVGVQGNVNVQSNIFVGNDASVSNLTVRGFHVGNMYFSAADTIYINGSPVQTAATAFNGGTVGLSTIFADTTQSTTAVSGAVQVRGGLGVAGNVWAGNIHANIGGNVRANVQGNIFTAAQPYITSVGTLTGLDINGQLNVNDISPNANNTYALGTGSADRWNKLWVFDIDMSGTLTGGTINGTGGSHTGNISINTATAASLRTTTAVGELFESGATTLRIGGAATSMSIGPTSAATLTYRATTGSLIPGANATVNLGSSTAYWGSIFAGQHTGNTFTVGAGGITSTGNLAVNTPTNSGITTSQTTAYVFNETATTLRIGGAGITQFNNNTQATSTSTGAIQLKGGMSINTGSLYIGGSAGSAIVATGNILPSGNVVSTNNIGSDTAWWNQIYGVSVQALYADLAENYVADDTYEPGTVIVFGGDQEITVTDSFADTRVAGVISSNPAYLMNAASPGVPVALRGRVPVKILGTVSKGDLLVTSSHKGFAQSVGQSNSYGHAVFAKSLVTDGRNGARLIEAVIL